MSRLEKLNEAISQLFNDGDADNTLSVIFLVLGCILHDEMLDRIRELPYPIFAKLLREWNDANSRGDLEAIEAIKADARAVQEHITGLALEIILRGAAPLERQ